MDNLGYSTRTAGNGNKDIMLNYWNRTRTRHSSNPEIAEAYIDGTGSYDWGGETLLWAL